MAGYTKLFNSILASTIWREDDKTRIVWITLLAMADKNGIAEASVPGLADMARVSVPACRKALAALQAPDPDSRTQTHDGRRIAPVEGGWQLLNHAKYRAKLNVDERREYLRLKQREYRKHKSTSVNNVSDKSTVLTQAEAEAEAEEQKSVRVSRQASDAPTQDVAERAGRFIERYEALYVKHRKGARYIVRPHRDFDAACDLCKTWPDERLDLLAAIFLESNHQFAESGSRTIPQFRALAGWCDGELVKHEQKHGAVPA